VKYKCQENARLDPGAIDAEFFSEIEAHDAETAAEIFAEMQYEGGDPFDGMNVVVTDENGIVEEFRVAVEYDVSFAATKETVSGG
jgi:hypothetical protein